MFSNQSQKQLSVKRCQKMLAQNAICLWHFFFDELELDANPMHTRRQAYCRCKRTNRPQNRENELRVPYSMGNLHALKSAEDRIISMTTNHSMCIHTRICYHPPLNSTATNTQTILTQSKSFVTELRMKWTGILRSLHAYISEFDWIYVTHTATEAAAALTYTHIQLINNELILTFHLFIFLSPVSPDVVAIAAFSIFVVNGFSGTQCSV